MPNAFTIDGTLDQSYGAPLSLQTVQTQFGDNFNELNAGYAIIDDGNLYLMLTGNMEANFNNWNIFIDSVPGGQNVLDPDTNNGGTNPPNASGWAQSYAGFTFDSGFEADFLLTAQRGDLNSGGLFNLDITRIGGGASGFTAFSDIFNGANEGSVTVGNFEVGFDNSNVAGVTGGTAAADQSAAAAVSTGLELKIPLSEIGNPTGEIKISAMINNGDHNFLSNQFLGGLAAPQGNLGGDGSGSFTRVVGAIDLNNFAGEQFFRVDSTTSPTGRIGNRVWSDDNANGYLDRGEAGVQGVTVTLTDAGPDGNIGTRDDGTTTTTTNANGVYNFTGLEAGDYKISVSNLPNGATLSPANAGSNDNRDSDVDPATGSTEVITLADAQIITTVDIGVLPPGASNGIVGTASGETLGGTQGNDNIMGGGGNDNLIGRNGKDILNGTGDSEEEEGLIGAGEIDRLVGGGDEDTFVLGNRETPFYVAQRAADRAIIGDFNSAEDTVQLFGDASLYETDTGNGNTLLFVKSGAIGNAQRELIGTFLGGPDLDLNSGAFEYLVSTPPDVDV